MNWTDYKEKERLLELQKKNAPKPDFGVSSPISKAHATEDELRQTEALIELLKEYNAYESVEEFNHRIDVLAKLYSLVRQWVREVTLKKKMPQSFADNVGGAMFTFGSFRLGVHGKGADIDALCVAPRHIDRVEYFTSFLALLQKQEGVTEIRPIEDAFVPVIKMKFNGVEIDMLYARLADREVSENISFRDTNMLRNLDMRCIRSLNGCRVTDEIINQVPDFNTFRTALRAIKMWAKRRLIYGNSLGYFGGVSWGLLVARTCQLYPNAAPASLVRKFFLVFANWKWPSPVLLKKTEEIDLGFPVWDPRVNVGDRAHLMPIITPSYPEQNSTYNVTLSTRDIIRHEIFRGDKVTQDIFDGVAKWDKLFEAPIFWHRYRFFLVIIAVSPSKKDHLEWVGLVESKIRKLILLLEQNRIIELVHVHPKCHNLTSEYPQIPCNILGGFDPTVRSQMQVSMWFCGVKANLTSGVIDLTNEINVFAESLHQQASKQRMYKDTMGIEVRPIRRKQLMDFLPERLIKEEKQLSGFARQSLLTVSTSTSTLPSTKSQISSSSMVVKPILNKKRRLSETDIVNNEPSNRRLKPYSLPPSGTQKQL